MNPHNNPWLLFDFMSANPFKTGQQLSHYHWVRDKADILIWPNRIYNITPDLTDDTIDLIIAKVKAEEYPPEIQFHLDDSQQNNINKLKHKGFKTLREFPALSVNSDSASLDWSFPTDWKVTVKQVNNLQKLTDWSILLGNGFWSNPKDLSKPLYNIYESIYQNSDNLKLFICFVNGIPAATSMAFNSAVSGGIYLVYVKPEYRKHGLGAMMTKEAEQWSFRQGQQTVILQATPLGEPVYKRMGYKVDFFYTILVPEESNLR